MQLKNVAYLPHSFLITAIAGFVITAIYIMPRDNTWGFTFLIFFAVMFISAFVSITHGPIVKEK